MEKSIKNKIKILRISNETKSLQRSGQGKSIFELSESKFFNTTLFTPCIDKKIDSYIEIKNLNYFYFPNIVFPKNPKKIIRMFFSLRRLIAIMIASLNLVFNKKIYFNEIVHIHHIFYFLPALILKIIGSKIIVTIHGSDINKIQGSIVLRNLLKLFDRVLCVSHKQQKILSNFISKKKLFYVGNGVNTDFYKPNKSYLERKKVILSVGNLRWQKNYNLLIEAFSIVHKSNKDWKLVICGEGPDRNEIQELIKLKKLDRYVFLKGYLNQKDIKNWMQTSRIFVMSSRVEGFPKALLEAAACGCACVSTNAGDCDYFLKDIGFIARNNKYDLANKITKLINSSNLSKTNSLQLINRAKSFTWKKYIDLHRNIYEKLL